MIRKGLTALFSVLVVFLLCAFWTPGNAPVESSAGTTATASESSGARTTIARNITLRVYLNEEEGVREIPLEEYVAGVIAAEMPDSYAREALRAQAVSARTFAVHKSALFSGEGCASHADADVCASSGCCQGYFPARPEDHKNAILAASDTRGMIALFHARPIRALYHASSGGHTENAENVYSEALAYLRGVPSPGEESYSRFETIAEMDLSALREAFRSYPDVLLLEQLPLSEQLEVLSRSETGRVTSVRVGLCGMSGSDFRRALGLKSAMFQMEFPGDRVVFHMTGYGHGVGMSQAGAQAMALSGKTFQEILCHYYTGISLSTLSEWLESG